MKDNIPDELRIRSEVVEPSIAYIIGRLYAQCKDAKDDELEFFSRCQTFWNVINKISRLASALDTPHFSIAARNQQEHVARYIKDELNIDAYAHPQFKPLSE